VTVHEQVHYKGTLQY